MQFQQFKGVVSKRSNEKASTAMADAMRQAVYRKEMAPQPK